MCPGASPLSAAATPVLLVEADLDARGRHEHVLLGAGYEVTAFSACPDTDDLSRAAILLTDVPTFYWLRDRQARHLPPVVVLSMDEKAGVTACLYGAAAWVPSRGEGAYLLDTVEGVLHPVSRVPAVSD